MHEHVLTFTDMNVHTTYHLDGQVCTIFGNFLTYYYLYNSYGTVVRDFESEAKTR